MRLPVTESPEARNRKWEKRESSQKWLCEPKTVDEQPDSFDRRDRHYELWQSWTSALARGHLTGQLG